MGYPSDISLQQFAIIQPILESVRKKTKPRVVDLHQVFLGVLYVLKSDCQWRMLPKDFPPWATCYAYYRKWTEKPDEESPSALERALKKVSQNGPKTLEAETEDLVCDRGCPKRQEHGYR